MSKKKSAPPDRTDVVNVRAAEIEAATGMTDPKTQNKLLNQAVALSHGDRNLQSKVDVGLTLLAGIGPKDAVESMLAAQMVATHDAAMALLKRSHHPQQDFPGMDMTLKHAIRLLQLYTRQVETLAKYRGKGQQKITVEHVTVEAGGQAIVGNVTAGAARSTGPQPPQALTDQSGNEILVPAPRVTEMEKATRRKDPDTDG